MKRLLEGNILQLGWKKILLQSALNYAPRSIPVHKALIELYKERHRDAEVRRDQISLTQLEERLRVHLRSLSEGSIRTEVAFI